jgi:hypothetical protein
MLVVPPMRIPHIIFPVVPPILSCSHELTASMLRLVWIDSRVSSVDCLLVFTPPFCVFFSLCPVKKTRSLELVIALVHVFHEEDILT